MYSFKTSKLILVPCLAMSLWILSGCYTFTGSTLPSHLKTINVLPIQNETLEPAFGQDLRQAVIEGFNRNSRLRLVPSRGNCDLILVLKSYSHKEHNVSNNNITDYRIDVRVGVEFVDRVKNKVLFKENNIPGYATYSVVNGESETTGKEKAIQALVETILDNTISGW